jgi:hypothetical protein
MIYAVKVKVVVALFITFSQEEKKAYIHAPYLPL